MTGLTRDELTGRDLRDPLAGFRDRFELPPGIIYLDGNSLGALPKGVAERLDEAVREEWGGDLITSWNRHGWIDLPRRAGDKIARLIGAAPGEVVVADSTSVNLFKLLAAALSARPDRRIIVTEADNFPTDVYIAQGLLALLSGGHALRRVDGEDLAGAIDDDTAVVLLTHVHYQTGRVHDMEAITGAAHEAGALVLWDLSHSAGALPVDLSGADADLAVGCGYKYLNGGPGAPGYLYVAKRLQESIRPPLSGWMGHEAPFAFEGDYRPAQGIGRNLCGTPPVLSMIALDAALDLMLEADIRTIREKSLALTGLFIELVEQECAGLGIEAVALEPARRGSHVSLRHENGYPVMRALIARGVIGDFRAPDLMRFGFAPLYLRYIDIWGAVAALRDILETGAWDDPAFHKRAAVT